MGPAPPRGEDDRKATTWGTLGLRVAAILVVALLVVGAFLYVFGGVIGS
jgi:hypothetical protein